MRLFLLRLWSVMCDLIIWPDFAPDTQRLSGSTVSKQHPTSRRILTLLLFFSHSHIFCPSISHHDTRTPWFLCCSLVKKWIRIAQRWSDTVLPFPTPLSALPSTKVRGHRAGLRSSPWHLEVRAARRSGAWGSVSSMCRNTTFSSCWRTALCSCAPLGQTGPWPSSGSTSRGWRRFVQVFKFSFFLVFVFHYHKIYFFARIRVLDWISQTFLVSIIPIFSTRFWIFHMCIHALDQSCRKLNVIFTVSCNNNVKVVSKFSDSWWKLNIYWR